MSREIAVVSLGFLGLGLTYTIYKLFTSGKKEIKPVIHNLNKNAWDSDSKKIDIFVVYSQKDFDKAETFQRNVDKYVSTKDVHVVLMDDFGHGMTIFRAFEQGLKSSIYTFVLVTETFIKDEVKKFLAGNGLMENLQSSNRLWRLVPVWVNPGINEPGKCPLEFSVLQGLRYDRFLEDEREIRCFENIDRLLEIGREN